VRIKKERERTSRQEEEKREKTEASRTREMVGKEKHCKRRK